MFNLQLFNLFAVMTKLFFLEVVPPILSNVPNGIT